MEFKKALLALTVACAANAANATVIQSGSEQSLQSILDSITLIPAHNSSVDVNTDQVELDDYWAINGSGGAFAQLIIEIAGNANVNTFGIYDRNNTSNYVQLFSGAQNSGAMSVVSILMDGSVLVNFADTGVNFAGNAFGFYLGTPSGAFYSDSTLNQGGNDQMVAFAGPNTDTIQIGVTSPGVWSSNEYVLAFEDTLYQNSDKDFNDLVVMVESVTTVPEPSSVALLGLGLIGLGAARRKQAKA